MVRGATDDEWEDAEDNICREKHDERKSCGESDVIVNSPKELTEREEEKEDRDVEEDCDTLDHPPHLKLGQAFEEICMYAATLLGRSAELGCWKYSRAHCWISVDISAHVKLRNRLRNIRILMRIAILDGAKGCVTVDGMAEGITDVLLFGWDWATS